MKVIYVPGLEEGLKAIIERFAITKDGGKIPILLIPDEIARKTDLAGFLKTIPAATVSSLGGVKLYSSTTAATTDRTYGRIGNDAGGYTRVFPAQVVSGQRWAGVVNVIDAVDAGASFQFTDVYNCAAVNAEVTQLMSRLSSLESWKATVETWHTTYASKVNALENAKKQSDAKIAALEAANADLAARVKALEDKPSEEVAD